jgi:hypothetical protein
MRKTVCLCLIKHQAVKVADVWLRAFLILSSVRRELLASHSGCLIAGKISRYPLDGRLSGTRGQSEPCWGEEKYIFSFWESNPNSPVVNLATRQTKLFRLQ